MKLLVLLALFALSYASPEEAKVEQSNQAVDTVTKTSEIPSASDDRASVAKVEDTKSTAVTGEPAVTESSVKKADEKESNLSKKAAVKASRKSRGANHKKGGNKKSGHNKTQAKHHKKAGHGKAHKRAYHNGKDNKRAQATTADPLDALMNV